MDLAGEVLVFIFIYVLMVAATVLLRARKAVGVEHAPLISRIVMDLSLPALIFSHLAGTRFNVEYLAAGLVVWAAELAACLLALVAGRALRLDRPALGSFLLCSTFGSTSLVGNVLLDVVYRGHQGLIAIGLFIGQFGVGLPNNTVGLLIGMRYTAAGSSEAMGRLMVRFLLSMPVLAILAGLAWSALHLPIQGGALTVLFGAATLMGSSLPLLSAMVTGLTLQPVSLRGMLPAILLSQSLQLIVKPLIAFGIMVLLAMPVDHRMVMMLSAMPASPLAVIYAARYGGDTALSTTLVSVSLLMSFITLPVMVALL